MTFNALPYAVFLPVIVLAYWRLDHRRQNLLLVVGSWIFYGWWDPRFLVLLWVSTGIDFVVGRRLHTTSDESRRRGLVAVSAVANLGILGFFKYADFFADSAATMLERLGLAADLPTLQILLPVGISFYTFQTMSYTIDIYRRRLEPTPSIVDFAAYVAFFPQLVAGPVERAHHLLPQLTAERQRPDATTVQDAVTLIMVGLFKKVAIADALAPLVADVYGADPAGTSSLRLLLGAIAFKLQIYGDFAGYTDIARGSARLLGVELVRNFRQPHMSRNVSEFWRRWHLSLSTWLRDYLYIPLGGSRRGRGRKYVNLMITMVLGGLWHGATWGMAVWGGLHGIALIVHQALGGSDPTDERLRIVDLPRIASTFLLLTLFLVFFRLPDLGDAVAFLGGIAAGRSGAIGTDLAVVVAWAATSLWTIDWLQRRGRPALRLRQAHPATQGLAWAGILVPFYVFSASSDVPFFYFQF